VGITASVALMWLLYNPYGDPSRVYFGTDTRAFLLLMGILLALVWPWIEKSARALPLLELLGVAALVATVLLFRQMQDFNPTLYRGGDLAAAFCFVVLIAAVAHPRTGIGRGLGVAPLRWVGERSYGIYLWHWPIIILLAGVNARPSPGVVAAEAALVLAIAGLSYRFVEEPIRRGRLQQRLAGTPRRRRLELIGAGAVALVAAFAVLFVVPRSLNPVNLYANPGSARAATKPSGSHTPPRASTRPQPVSGTTTPRTSRLHALPPGRILALGDSVMLGCTRQLKGSLHHRVRIDAKVGRQILDTVEDLDHLRAKHRLPKTVVLQVGNNGPLWYRDLVKLRHALRGIPDVVVVNVRNDTSWQDESNQALANWLHGWPAAHLADWYGNSTSHMLQDGTHPYPYGCTIYARTIADTLRSA
jgi:acyltransferase-like protein